MQRFGVVLRKLGRNAGWRLMALIGFQILCTLVLVIDVLHEATRDGGRQLFSLAMLPEFLATLGLCLGMVVEGRFVLQMRRKQADMARGLSVAAGAIDSLMRRYFRDWELTPAESDVAAFTIKGFSITEVAQLRGSAEGTVKTHLNAIYRKAGVSGRAQLVSLLVEELFAAPLPGQSLPDRQSLAEAG
ncbi:helix-turn-helix transcriptional regulator [Cypionkella sp.]|uniref:helix-turn-helix transcriptional regulator n=1 Tax=Cypionkella sp. TaxID=2811411 RepID=UPI002FDEC61D